MSGRRTEIQVGLTVLTALLVLLLGVTWLKNVSVARGTTTWHVRFPETGGLGSSDQVLVNGIRKGMVGNIALLGDSVCVDLALDASIRLTRASHVAIRNVGIMGERVIAVDLRTGGPAWSPADTIPGAFEPGLGEVLAAVGGSMASMDRVIASLDRLTTRLDRGGDVDTTIAALRRTSVELAAALAEDRRLLHETLANSRDVSRTARALTTARQAELERTLGSIERTSANVEALSARLDSLRAVAQSIADKADHGDGSLARLLNDKDMHEDVRATLESVRKLVDDVRQHPRRYINLHLF